MKFVRIKDIMSVNRGASPRPISNTAYFSETGTYGWVRISDVTKSDKHLFNTEERLSDLGASFSVKLDKPTLFLSIAGSVGKACINKIPVCIHDGFVYFSSIKNYDINYLFWFFSNSIIYEGLGKKGVFLNLNIDTIKNILIPKLKIDEQLKISKFLDTHCSKIDNEVSLLQQKSILLDEYKNALIYETVTKGLDKNAEMKDSGVEWIGKKPKDWVLYKLKNIVIKNNRGNSPSYEDDDLNKDFPIINQSCVQKEFINFNKVKYNKIDPKGLKGRLKNGDILICSTGGGTVGRVGYWSYDFDNYIADSHVTIVRTSNKHNSRYLYYCLSSVGGSLYIKTCIKGATNQEEFSNKSLNNFKLSMPDISVQNEIALFLDHETKKIENKIELINKKVKLLKEYKQSLIYEAVTGQLEIE
jgi:type I restriction enzyme S subunit